MIKIQFIGTKILMMEMLWVLLLIRYRYLTSQNNRGTTPISITLSLKVEAELNTKDFHTTAESSVTHQPRWLQTFQSAIHRERLTRNQNSNQCKLPRRRTLATKRAAPKMKRPVAIPKSWNLLLTELEPKKWEAVLMIPLLVQPK